ncbi:MAG: hypothetical protein U0L79_01355 [Lachnospiraceae bacterium]|nr:hypothetical protein [Lachnospiraceae bacterium]
MIEIKMGQTLELDNVLSFRGKLTQSEVEQVGRDMETKISDVNAKLIGHPIMATFAVDSTKLDMELICPIDKKINSVGEYVYKEKIKIINAVMMSYKGNPDGLQEACNELNKYIIDNKLQPITVGYNVTKKIDPLDINNAEIDVYVGINPNIL